jgi:hypothetical protein
LANVLITVFNVLETLGPDCTDDSVIEREDELPKEGGKESSCNYFGKALSETTKKEKDFEGHRPFCETGFVTALCEGLKELMKDPKPRRTQKMTSPRYDGRGEDGTVDRDLADMELPIPDGLIQTAILNGLSSLYFFNKTTNGKEALRKTYYYLFLTIVIVTERIRYQLTRI